MLFTKFYNCAGLWNIQSFTAIAFVTEPVLVVRRYKAKSDPPLWI
jgi:hypothetical protein